MNSLTSMILRNLSKKLNKNILSNKLSDAFADNSISNIYNGLDINGIPFRTPLAGNKPLIKTGSLFASIKSTANVVSFNDYGEKLQKGVGMLPRKFFPEQGSELFKRITKQVIEEELL